MKKYVVVEKTRKQGILEILNKDTTSLTDIWHSVVSFKNLINLDYKILTFNNRSEAEKYRKVQQKTYNEDWKKWGHYFKAMGQNKPKWVVEEYQNIFNSQNYQTV
jgi:hypothetical protein